MSHRKVTAFNRRAPGNPGIAVMMTVNAFFMVINKPKPTYLGEEIPISGDGELTNDLD